MSEPHLAPGTYVLVFLGLLALTALTVSAAYVDLGPLSTPVALAIAVTKGLLVLAFFMHLRFTNRLVWLAAASGFIWLALLIGGTVVDVLTRGTHTIGGPFVQESADSPDSPDSTESR